MNSNPYQTIQIHIKSTRTLLAPYSIGQQQRIVNECKSAGIPSLFVKRGKKYGKIEYDFLHTDYMS